MTGSRRAEGPDGPLLVRRTLRLPPEPGSARLARLLLRDVLTSADRADSLAAAELACTELVTNVLLHAHTEMEVTVEVGDDVRVAVRDFSPAPPFQRHYDVDATTGRGLGLVAAVSDAHGIADAGPGGKTLWFTVGAPAPDRDSRPAEQSTPDPDGAWDPAWDAAGWPAAATSVAREGAGVRAVRLLRVPPGLWLVARQHHDAMLRELAFYRTAHEAAVDLAAADRARFLISNAVVAVIERTARSDGTPSDAGHATRGGPPEPAAPFDLELRVPVDAAADVRALQHALDTAEELAAAGRLLTRPGSGDVVAVRNWACDEITAQLTGSVAQPWTGASH